MPLGRPAVRPLKPGDRVTILPPWDRDPIIVAMQHYERSPRTWATTGTWSSLMPRTRRGSGSGRSPGDGSRSAGAIRVAGGSSDEFLQPRPNAGQDAKPQT